MFFVFFFSSRRRHTRSYGDWSSDVCSSDLSARVTGIRVEAPGLSVFYKDEHGGVFHTYSSYARGLDLLVGAYNYLDLVRSEERRVGKECRCRWWAELE